MRGRLRGIVSSVAATSLAAAALVGVGLAAPAPAFAAPGDPFDPSAPVVYIAQGGPSQLQRAETTGDGTFAFTNEGGLAPVSYNAIGFNPANNYMYGMVAGNATAALPLGALVRIGQSGVVTRVGTTVYTHPGGSTRWFAGAFNPADGLYYISDSGPNTTVRALNASTGAIVRTIDLGQNPGVQDFAFKDGYAWGANNAGDIRRLDVTTGSITVFSGILPLASGGYGAVWNFGNGNLGFSSNVNGNVTQLAVTNGASATPTFDIISTVPGPSSSLNDGTSIPGLPADLEIEKVGPAAVQSGDRIGYEITVTNNGAGVSSGWTVTDVLPAGLGNPTVVGNVTSSITGNEISVSGGRLGIGESASFTIEVDDELASGACVENVASVLGNEEDPDPSNNEDAAQTCDLELAVTKTSDATPDSRPGDVVTYTVTATNTGEVDYTDEVPAVVFDDLSGVLDDAEYNADASASAPGTIAYQEPLISWSGALAAGDSVDLTYTVTLQSGGDGEVRNVTWIPGDPEITTPPTCGPATDGVDDATGQPCAVEEFDLPRLTIAKSVDTTELPAIGEQATFTIVVTNAGPGEFTIDAPATATDDLSEVLDDATFDDASLSADVGTVTRSGDELTWSGPLAAGAQATVTYSVTYTGEGDQILRNLACIPEDATVPGAESCDTVQVPGALLTQWKTAEASADPVVAGSTITYTLHFDNDGQSDAAIDAVDDLTHVLDDAQVTSEPISPDALTVSRSGAQISVTGTVPAGQTFTVVYTVTVLPDDERGDSVATNFLLAPGETPPPGGECESSDPDAPNCTTTPITGVAYAKSVEASESPVRTGTELTYTIVVINTGATEVDVVRDDDLSGVLDDASLTGAPVSDTASVTVDGPTDGILEIRGTLAAGEVAEITYTVTVNGADERGDSVAANFLVPPGTPPGECEPDSGQCTSTPIQGFAVAKSSDVATVLPGGVVVYTVTVTNTGAVAYTDVDPAAFDDDLSAVLDDATYNGDITVGGEVTGDTLTWSGPLAVGETATVTYSVTVDDPVAGDSVLTNAVVPTGPTGECLPDECTTETPVSSFTVSKTSSASQVMAGDTITYTVTVTNTGQVDYTDAAPAAFDDDLSAVLDDATYNDDVSAGGTVTGTALSWAGALAIGGSIDVTYSVTVNAPLTGDGVLVNAVVPIGPGGSCDPDAECTTTTDVASYTVSKASDASTVLPGDTVTYTLTVSNTGDVAYTEAAPASLTDDLSGVLDDAVYNDDASNGATVTGSTLEWSGPLAVGETVTITYSVTVDDPVTGDFVLRNAVIPTGPGGDCDGVCETETPVGSYRVAKSTATTEVVPGDTVEYTITVTNIGQVAYTDAAPASFSDDLSAVLDDATYNGDATSSSGAGITYTEPQIAWSGPLGIGETVTITYSVVVNDPATGDRHLDNTVVTPPGSGSNCAPDSTDPACVANVPAASYSIAKSASTATVLPGGVVTYTISVTNTGAIAYTDAEPASFTDDLSRVLDDATYNGDVSTGGSVEGDVLTWSGPLEVGETVQVTYTVTVSDPVTGDFSLRNVVVPSAPGGECVEGECVTDTPVAAYTVEKSSDVDDVVLGGTVTYAVTVRNTGQVDYSADAPASFTDDMSGVLDDAAYNGDATAGAELVGETLLWSGALPIDEEITVTYSVTVNSPATGDGILRNAVIGDGPGGDCSSDDGCVVETPIASFRVEKAVSSERATVGDRVTFVIAVTNTGQVAYTDERPASFVDDLSSALAVATYNEDATNGAVYERPVLSWSGAVDVGETVTVSYSVTLTAVGEVRNVVVTPDGSGANCPVDSDDADCATTTVVVPPGLAITGGALWVGGAAIGAALLALGLWLAARRRREASTV